MSTMSKPVQFEKALADLEGLVEKLEQGELTLEQSLKAFEKGVQLTRTCQKALNDAEQKVQMLVEENGSDQLVDFTPDDDTYA